MLPLNHRSHEGSRLPATTCFLHFIPVPAVKNGVDSAKNYRPNCMSLHRFLWLLRNDPPIFAVAAFLSWLGYRRPIPPNPQRILIYKPDHLGDVLLATPAVRAIRQRYPSAEINIMVGAWAEQLLQNNPDVDGVRRYNSKKFVRGTAPPTSLRQALNDLEGWKPDLVISLRDDWAMLRASIGSRTARVDRGTVQWREWLNRKKTGRAKRHETELLWETLAPIGIAPQRVEQLLYFVSREERIWANAFLPKSGVHTHFMALHPGASTELKKWEPERFAAVARQLTNQWGMQIVLIGSPDEQAEGAYLAELLSDLQPVNLSGKLQLRQTAAVIEQASIYIASDGGMMHIASAVGVATVGLFGPGYGDVFRPVGNNVRTINHYFPCSPCSQQRCIRPNDTCMMAITPEEVIAASNELLGDTLRM